MLEEAYLDLAKTVLTTGHEKTDRTGTGTISLFGYQMRFNLQEGFPLLTTKKVPFGLIKSELLWFLRGDTNIRFLLQHHNHIWDEWAFQRYVDSPEYHGPDMTDFGRRSLVDADFNQQYQAEKKAFCGRIVTDQAFGDHCGDLGLGYGSEWRGWRGHEGVKIDQLDHVNGTVWAPQEPRRMDGLEGKTAWEERTGVAYLHQVLLF